MGQVVDDGRSGGRGVEHPCPGQEVLQTHPGDALLRSLGLAPRSFPAGSVGHGVRFVEHDHAIEIFTGPGENLVEARCVARSEEHTSELQSLMRNSYAVFCLKKKNKNDAETPTTHNIESVT